MEEEVKTSWRTDLIVARGQPARGRSRVRIRVRIEAPREEPEFAC